MRGGCDSRVQAIVWMTVTVLVGLPVWWKTTEVYRANLPHDHIQSLVNSNIYKPWKIELNVMILSNQKEVEGKVSSLQKELQQKMGSLARPEIPMTEAYVADFAVSVAVASPKDLESVKGMSLDELDNYLRKNIKVQDKNGHYTFFLLSESELGLSSKQDTYMGKYRHGWIQLSSWNSLGDVPAKIQSLAHKYFVPNASDLKMAQRWWVPPSHEYRISFSLLNEDPHDRLISWNFKEATHKYLNPFINKLSTVADVSVDSQVLQFASLLQKPLYDKEKGYYALKSESLSHFLNPHEWKLDTTDTKTHPCLNFILYIPAQHQSPLVIQLENGKPSQTNSFVMPQWGGIVLYNMNSTSKEIRLNSADLEPIMQLFISQLRELFGMSSLTDQIVPSKEDGIALWELDILMRRHTFHNVNSALETMQSLSKLVSNLTNMVVLDNIAELCDTSLTSLDKSILSLESGNYEAAFQQSRTSFVASEKAFFDPNMLSLLYFPNEHKLAIYALPFIPMAFQLITAIHAEWKARRYPKKQK